MMGEGRFFEDFGVGQHFAHEPARTISAGDVSLHIALTGNRFPLYCDTVLAGRLGYRSIPIEESLLFNIVFGQSVADISYNAVANLGYAQCQFMEPVFQGDTVRSESSVIGTRPVSRGDAGIVYVHTQARNQQGRVVLSFVRWVMVRSRSQPVVQPEAILPNLSDIPEAILQSLSEKCLIDKQTRYPALVAGQWIDHVAGTTVEHAEHQMATRLYQNPARLHFDHLLQQDGQFQQRLVYGGYVIALARAASFNGLGKMCQIVAIHGGRHAAPVFAGDTLYFASKIVSVASGPAQTMLSRIKTFAFKNKRVRTEDAASIDDIVLELEYSAVCGGLS